MSFNIWNNLDEIALYLGLKRLDSESNESFFNRIRLFGKWRYKTDYLTQVHSIPLQTGLQTNPIVKIISPTNYECTIDWEYCTIKNDQETIRVYINNSNDTVGKILQAIDNSNTFSYFLYDEVYRNVQLKYLVRNSNIKTEKEYMDVTNFNLSNKNIKQGTVGSMDVGTLITEKSSVLDLVKTGDYFVDYVNGYIQIFSPNFLGSFITYKYYDEAFVFESTELNLFPTNLKFKYGMTDECVDLIPNLLNGQVWG